MSPKPDPRGVFQYAETIKITAPSPMIASKMIMGIIYFLIIAKNGATTATQRWLGCLCGRYFRWCCRGGHWRGLSGGRLHLCRFRNGRGYLLVGIALEVVVVQATINNDKSNNVIVRLIIDGIVLLIK